MFLYHNYILAWINLFNINNQLYFVMLYILRKYRYIYSSSENNKNLDLLNIYRRPYLYGIGTYTMKDIIEPDYVISSRLIFELFKANIILKPEDERIIIEDGKNSHNLLNYTAYLQRYQIFDILLDYVSSDYINFKTLVYAVKSKNLDIFIKVYQKYADRKSLIDGYYNYQILANGAAAFSLPILKYILQVAKNYEFNYPEIYKRALPKVKYYLEINKK